MLLFRRIYYFNFILITMLISCASKQSKQAIKKEPLFQATYDPGVGGCSLVFYKDGTCLYFGGIASDDVEGNYHLKDSIITLEGIPLRTCLKSNKLIITTYSPYEHVSGDSILIQVDAQLNIVDSIHIFTKVH
jgi:hypothetical protein